MLSEFGVKFKLILWQVPLACGLYVLFGQGLIKNNYRRIHFTFLGMTHAGMGATHAWHVNNFLAGLNVPPVHSSAIRKKEKEIGKKIQEVATESFKAVQIKEKALSNGKEN